jgi:hypothetical protein
MRLLERGGRALLDEARLLLAHLRDWRLALAIGIFAALLLLAAQAPLSYTIEVGQADGPGGDLPLVAGFHDPELSDTTHSNFRWTTEQSLIRLPGVGQRAIQLTLRLSPVNDEVARRGPQAIEVWDDRHLLGQLLVRPVTGATYRLLLPPPADLSGDQAIELRSTTFVPTGDARSIGTAVDWVRVQGGGGPHLPAWRSTLAWLGAALLLWLALRRAGFGPNAAQALLWPALLLASLAALLDPPRFAFGGGSALVALALGWLLVLLICAEDAGLLLAGAALALPAIGLALLGGDGLGKAALGTLSLALLLAGWLRPALAALYRRYAPPIAPAARRWLLLIALLVFTTRYGGKIYPDSMPGDIGFHANRYADTIQGTVLLLSRNRGVDFPYPPAFYLLLAPFSLPGLDRRILIRLSSALLDAASPLLVYAIATSLDQRPTTNDQRSALRPSSSLDPDAPCYPHPRRGLLAAGIYSFSASGLMTTWWNFSTHIFTQFAHLLLIAVLVLLWRPTTDDRRPTTDGDPQPVVGGRWSVVGGLVVLQSLVYLGHFGFWMNMSLLGGIGLAVLLVAALRGRVAWRQLWPLLLAFAAAELFAALFFYSGYTGLFLTQAQATTAGGLTGLAGRAPVDRAVLWRTLWDAGFRVHFGFFPVPLALCGLLLLWRRTTNDQRAGIDNSAAEHATRNTQHVALIVLIVGTFTIALLVASLPFLSGSTLSTRWLMFSAWAIAVAAAVAAQALWHTGRAGRLLVLAMGGYVVWVTASMWLGALAWRVRPPEPF